MESAPKIKLQYEDTIKVLHGKTPVSMQDLQDRAKTHFASLATSFAISYLDSDNDSIAVENDDDLKSAIAYALTKNEGRIKLLIKQDGNKASNPIVEEEEKFEEHIVEEVVEEIEDLNIDDQPD